MRISIVLLLALAAQHVSANDVLWAKLEAEPDLVVLMRHTQRRGGRARGLRCAVDECSASHKPPSCSSGVDFQSRRPPWTSRSSVVTLKS